MTKKRCKFCSCLFIILTTRNPDQKYRRDRVIKGAYLFAEGKGVKAVVILPADDDDRLRTQS